MPKNKGGRPTEYKKEYCERVIELGKKGFSRAMIARDLGFSRFSWYEWQKTHEEFSNAIKESMFYCLAWWEEQGQKSLYADKFNSSSFIFQMKNRFADKYREKSYVDQQNTDADLETKELIKNMNDEQLKDYLSNAAENKS